MTTETIIWTALPHGNTGPNGPGGTLKLAVFVAPRLSASGEPTLAQFPHFLDWPATLRDVRFEVRLAGGPALPATVVSAADSALWQALFDPSVGVDPFIFDQGGLTTGEIYSYPVMRVAEALKSRYTEVAKNDPRDNGQEDPTLLPSNEMLLRTFQDLKPPPDFDIGGLSYSKIPRRAIPPTEQPGGVGGDFAQLLRFFDRRVPTTAARSADALPPAAPPREPLPTPDALRKQLDFHSILAALGNHPHLLPLLGLVIELEVDLTVAVSTDAGATVQVDIAGLDGSAHVYPLTYYVLDDTGFRAAARGGSPLQDGLLRLGEKGLFDLLQFDVDGAALKAIGMVAAVEQSAFRATAGTPEESGLPALRSAGLSLVETGRAYNLAKHLGSAADLQTAVRSGSAVALYADDLVRGYAIDIYTEASGDAYRKQAHAWLSLCRRDGVYTLHKPGADKQLTVGDDEGFVTLGTSKAQAGGVPGHFLHESWLHWEGWSLAAPRPGKAVAPDGSSAEAANDPINQIGLQTRFRAHPGSLPRLRFGLGYAMRARAVDLAGHSVDRAAPVGDLPAVRTATHTYYRYEPISFPAVALRNSIKDSPGESQARLVIRSDYDRTVEQWYHEQSAPPYSRYAERHIVPPKTSEHLAEAHGMFDGPIPPGTPPDQRSWYEIIVKRDVSLHGDNADHPDAAAAPDPVFDTDRLQLPYLPDPLAAGACFLGLPGVDPAQPFVDATYGGTWPDNEVFRIEIVDPSGDVPAAPRWSREARKLTVEVAKADMIAVSLSSSLPPEALGLLGVWQWMVEAGLEGKFKKQAQQGLVWMLTPSRTITLVHAVQRPLIAPVFTPRLRVDRTPVGTHAVVTPLGSTSATLIDDPMPISGKSTAKLDFFAHWFEPIDDPAKPGPEVLTGAAHVSESALAREDTDVRFIARDPMHTQQFRDTKYRRVAYTAVATTRFREYFPSEITGDPANITRASVEGALQQPDAANPVSALPVNASHPLPLGVVDVPSTARPQTPKLLYVVPTFAQELQTGRDGSMTSTRSGGGLRVYLERPWYSSGDGELLGVVLAPENNGYIQAIRARRPTLKAPDASHLTQWGLDPAQRSRGLPAPYAPNLGQFPAAALNANGLSIDEQPGTAVAVAGHAVAYDADRRLWYCDITLDPGEAYYPFVRLALARYQPNSVGDTELSRIVVADFMQLAPDRSASIVIDGPDARLLRLAVSGPLPQRATNVLTASVEQQIGGGGDDQVGWIPLPNAQTTLSPHSAIVRTTKGIWTGTLQLPPLGTPPPPLRLVLREYEVYEDDSFSKIKIPTSGKRRLVYADVVDILLPD